MRIVISGNIGCGKTTQIHRLQHFFNNFSEKIEVIPEAVQEWIDEGWLEKFYQNQKKYALSFQYRVLSSQINVPDNLEKLIVIERSPYTTEQIFSKQLTEEGMISPEAFQGIIKYNEENAWTPDAMIYIRLAPETCFQRMKERNRSSEKTVPLEYLCKIHDKHEAFHNSSEVSSYIIDGKLSKDDVTLEILKILAKLAPTTTHNSAPTSIHTDTAHNIITQKIKSFYTKSPSVHRKSRSLTSSPIRVSPPNVGSSSIGVSPPNVGSSPNNSHRRQHSHSVS